MSATYYAIAKGAFIQLDIRTNQLEIYEDKKDAEIKCYVDCEVIEISVSRVEDKEAGNDQ